MPGISRQQGARGFYYTLNAGQAIWIEMFRGRT